MYSHFVLLNCQTPHILVSPVKLEVLFLSKIAQGHDTSANYLDALLSSLSCVELLLQKTSTITSSIPLDQENA